MFYCWVFLGDIGVGGLFLLSCRPPCFQQYLLSASVLVFSWGYTIIQEWHFFQGIFLVANCYFNLLLYSYYRLLYTFWVFIIATYVVSLSLYLSVSVSLSLSLCLSVSLSLSLSLCFHILVTDSILIQQYENRSGYSTRGYMLQKNDRQVGRIFFFTFLSLFFFYCIRRAFETLKQNPVKFKYSSHELKS